MHWWKTLLMTPGCSAARRQELQVAGDELLEDAKHDIGLLSRGEMARPQDVHLRQRPAPPARTKQDTKRWGFV